MTFSSDYTVTIPSFIISQIDVDFAATYPDKQTALYVKWTDVRSKLEELFLNEKQSTTEGQVLVECLKKRNLSEGKFSVRNQ